MIWAKHLWIFPIIFRHSDESSILWDSVFIQKDMGLDQEQFVNRKYNLTLKKLVRNTINHVKSYEVAANFQWYPAYSRNQNNFSILIAATTKLLGASLHASVHHQPITWLKNVRWALQGRPQWKQICQYSHLSLTTLSKRMKQRFVLSLGMDVDL